MTNAAGTISHGGGGSYNGGAFNGSAVSSATTLTGALYSSNHGSRRARRNASPSSIRTRPRGGSSASSSSIDIACCCDGICGLIGFMLCLQAEMNHRTRIGLLWFWLTVISVSVGVSIRTKTFGQQTMSASRTDMRQLDGLSPTFCSSVRVDSTMELDVYQFMYPPIILDDHFPYTKSYSVFISANHYEYWGFYMLQGSNVQISVLSSKITDFYIIKGKDNLKTFTDNSYCGSCYELFREINGYNSDWNYMKYDVDATDEYYFVFANVYTLATDVHVSLLLQRTKYQLTAASSDCLKSTECIFPLDLSSSEKIVYLVPKLSIKDDVDNDDDDITIHVTCTPRIYLYILIFGLAPFVLGLLISMLIIRRAKIRARTRSSTRTGSQVFIISDNEERLHGIANQSFSESPPSYAEPPPSYADLPPSYEEALRYKMDTSTAGTSASAATMTTADTTATCANNNNNTTSQPESNNIP